MAGSVTVVSKQVSDEVLVIQAAWTGDASDGSVPNTTVVLPQAMWLVSMLTKPGATQPTDNYDIALNDGLGVDVLGGAGANRDTANGEQVVPAVGSFNGPRFCKAGAHTLAISGNSVNSAIGTIQLFFSK